jgi:tyrosinase
MTRNTKPDRRAFLKGGSLTSVGMFVGGGAMFDECGAGIGRRPVRRNIAELTATDDVILAYGEAVRAMRALPAEDPRNWTRQARLHQDHCPHGNWLFLPWHRAYLHYFERICRKLSGYGDFALPYWDWSATPSVPAVFWGEEDNPLFYSPRRASPTSVAHPSIVGPARMQTILDEPNFLVFASGRIEAGADQREFSDYGPLEGHPHNYIHGFVGGTMGNFMSPLDPIFWTHHNMIERCWVDWNLGRYHDNTNDPAWTQRSFSEFCDEDGNPVTVTVAETLLYPFLLYRFDRLIGAPPPAPASEEEAIARVQRGAPVQIVVRDRLVAPTAAEATLEQPARIPLTVSSEQLERVRSGGARGLLSLDGVTLGHTEDFHVHLFLDKPDSGPGTPPEDPAFAGGFAFFAHAVEHHPGEGGAHPAATGSYLLDVSPALRRLTPTGGPIELSLVLIPFPERTPQTRSLHLASVELALIDG